MAAEHIGDKQFWLAIAILIKNYHALNKKIFEVLITEVQKQQDGKLHASNEDELEQQLQTAAGERTCDGFKIHFKMLTKKMSTNILANGVVDFVQQSYECHFVDAQSFDDFAVQLNGGELKVATFNQSNDKEISPSSRWAEFVLKPKLHNWSQSKREEAAQKSLHLLDVEKYNDLYKQLKQKHSLSLLELWQTANESTDPLKFIYEDLAIAAYLITLWSCTQSEPTGFADLGCGNGLLVYVLNAEGYKGYGYDVRQRKLWSLYPDETKTKLIERTVEPNSFRCEFDGIDWLIGNHSDELSPWLPVLAARLKCSYFLLPCCPFELSGAKFQRRNTCISSYQDFTLYARQVSQQCGFETLQDRLKIPSTKRIALIGLKRTAKVSSTFEDFVQRELQKYQTGESKTEQTVKLREKAETVRNCTQIEKSILDTLVLKIFRMLLDNTTDPESLTSESIWQQGRQLSMREIAQSLSKEELIGIKSECGGIKTLLRNKHEVFEFCGNDQIGLRKPKEITKLQQTKGKLLIIKKRACFFKLHHPQGCPLEEGECSFIH
ncbi:probable tRNA (uracil-O(2)-)-methyltransferase [Drosophila sulfurigaster albostrigata]|uniref:probable tRNA (uracil-O(2)-)-methyltransferase n=1 Tax=Drosophila sulfurigaster albostrigata TaxID=89887 RepID=UPI002D21B2B4|nr:probable tRNA (uracil-O(2)-)-methyltransferase [Drosophila sulfurigaster albostrigata]